MDKFTYQKALHGQPAFKGHAAARVVLQVIIDHAGGDLTNAWPSVRTIADGACVSTSTAREAIEYLTTQGFLIKQAGTRAKSNRYSLTLPGGVATTATPTAPTEPEGVATTATGCSDHRYSGVATTATDQVLYQSHSKPEPQTPDECVSPDATQGQGCVSPHDTQRVISCHAGVSPDDTEQVLEQVHSKPTGDALTPDWAPVNWHQLSRVQQARLYGQHQETTT